MFLMFLCQHGRVYVETRKMNVFVKPNEQRRACSNIVMARIGNRQHGALSEVERQNALFEEREKNVFVKPNEQRRACSNIVMARIGNRRHGALSEVERQTALLGEREKNEQLVHSSTCLLVNLSTR